MGIIKYTDGFADWLQWADASLFLRTDWTCPILVTSYSDGQWQWVDTDKYDLVPKESYKRELIAQKEKQLEELREKQKVLTEEVEKLRSG